MARNEQLIRQLRLIHLLEHARQGKTLTELRDDVVEDLGLDQLSERTVRRDLEALQSAGLDLDRHSSERGTVWKVGPRLQKPPHIVASAAELLALSMGRDLLAPLSGTPFWIGIESLWTKMRESLPDSVWKHFEEQRSAIVVRGNPIKSYAEKKGILATINRAIQQHRVLAIRYQTASDDKAKPRKIEPYATVLYRGSLYVVATAVGDSSARPPRHWKLDRFLSAEALDQRFKPTRGFDAAQHFQHSLGVFQGQSTVTARIHFEARSALWIRENPWSERQEIEALPNGGLVLTVFDAYETELMPRILALGDSATVLEPESLRIQIIEALESTRKRYG